MNEVGCVACGELHVSGVGGVAAHHSLLARAPRWLNSVQCSMVLSVQDVPWLHMGLSCKKKVGRFATKSKYKQGMNEPVLCALSRFFFFFK